MNIPIEEFGLRAALKSRNNIRNSTHSQGRKGVQNPTKAMIR